MEALVRSTVMSNRGVSFGSWILRSTKPGILRSVVNNLLAKPKISSRSDPTIWTSIGAGNPKLRI